ncbi:MFS family permease [Nocardioides luteus]|uniref:MFS transporter n=1 Tax=Nocardioides luteus TaxID=1844 RepID=A0ABQ5STY3_9ACTN|nr:MFS transporter [Nocardioides luteus]MDR7309227.1 MFS family permease [Nocardioides luteus]GGR48942.1 MFS transporter [Nocardioides luteus]GLJ67632.1 MFS transporter [Nocardioides luteus]
MYLSLSDRPTTTKSAEPQPHGGRVSRTVVTLGIVSLLTDISSESVSAILPLYLTAVVGLSPVAYGLIDGLYQGVSSLVRIAAGWAADRTDRPQPVALAGYAMSAVARLGLIFAGGFGTISAAISLDRVGKGVRTAPRDAMIAASSDPARLGRSFGVHRALDTIGATLGPLLAFVILWRIADGYDTVLVVSLGFAVLGVATMAFFVPFRTGAVRRVALRRERREPRVRVRWRSVLTPGLTRVTGVSGALALLTVGDGFVYLALLETGGFAAQWFPVLYVGTNLAYLALAVPMGRLADRVGRARVLVLGHLPLAAAYLCAASGSGALWTTCAAVLLLGVFYAATDGTLAAVAGQLVPATVRSTGIATAQTATAIARLLAATGFGLLWYAVGPQVAMLLVCAVLVAAIPVGFAVLRRGSLAEPAEVRP